MKYKAVLFMVLFLVASGSAWAQPSYLLSAKKEGALAIGIGSMALGNMWSGKEMQGFTEAELAALNPSGIPSWDRWALNRWDESAGHRSDWLFYSAAAWSSASVLIPAWKQKEVWASVPTAVLWVEMNALTLVATDLTKNLVTRPRPFTYYTGAPLEARMEYDARKSFFSGHTSMTAANTFYAAKVFADMYPDSKWKPWVWTAAAVLPALTAQQRMAAGKHYFTDVLVGYGVGALIGWGLPQLHLQR
jgi:membrane-associated phospholipid phosphatase